MIQIDQRLQQQQEQEAIPRPPTRAAFPVHAVYEVGGLVHVDPEGVVGDGVVELAHQDAPPILGGENKKKSNVPKLGAGILAEKKKGRHLFRFTWEFAVKLK